MTRRRGCWLTGETRRAVRDHVGTRDGWHCHYCRRPFADPVEATLDHYVPFSLWRENKPRNIVLACRPCNERKADALPLTLAWLLLRYAEQLRDRYAPAA